MKVGDKVYSNFYTIGFADVDAGVDGFADISETDRVQT